MDIFENDQDTEVHLSEQEKRRIEDVLEKLRSESGEHGISLVALKNARITKGALVQIARNGHPQASAVLSEINLRGILEEAKNPHTREEVATEMLARLVTCDVPTIRRRAIHLLLKTNVEKLMEIVGERSVPGEVRERVFAEVVGDEEVYLKLFLRILQNPLVPPEIREKIIARVAQIRRLIEESSAQIIEWNHKIEDLEKRKRIKFQSIEKFHKEVIESLDEFKTIPKFVMDLKFDVELAYQNLRETVKS